MSIITITRSSFLKRYIPSTARIVRTSLAKWDQFCFTLSMENQGMVPYEPASPKYIENFEKFNAQKFESEFFIEMRKEENKNKRYVILDMLVQSLLVDGITGKKLDVNTAKPYFNFICAWWRYNEIELDPYKIKNVKFPKKLLERNIGIDRKMISDIIALCDDMHKGIFLVCTFSGMRISEVLSMEHPWIDYDSSPLKISIPGKYTKTKQDRITFVGGDAESWIKKHRGISGPVFVNPKTGNRYPYASLQKYFDTRRTRLGLTAKKENGRNHIRIHSLRGYAENKLGRGQGGSEFAHSILGHRANLISYNESGKTDDDAANDYKSALPFLSLSEEQTLAVENKTLKDQARIIEDLTRDMQLLRDLIMSHPELAAKHMAWMSSK